MLKEIRNEVDTTLDDSIKRAYVNDKISFILFIGRGDVIPELKSLQGTECVIDYQFDRYYDETRDAFYLHYLNRNYTKEGFRYDGVSGIDDLSIEMMIYCHMWDSRYFLKSLRRLSAILCDEGYMWNVEVPEGGKYDFVCKKIIDPLKAKGIPLGDLVEKSFNTIFRNAFAHSLYNINVNSREIYTRTKEGYKTFSFDDFQHCFLYSVILMNRLQNVLELNHDSFARTNRPLTEPFATPEGIKVYVKGEMIDRGGKSYPEFRLVKVAE